MATTKVEAAGGVVVDAHGRLLVVHRPRYDDWSFPKGKLDAGETLEQCALREVLEETGYACALGEPLATIEYIDHKAREKTVYYWRMQPLGGRFEPNDEVDAIDWLSPPDVAERLSYERDLDVLGQVLGG